MRGVHIPSHTGYFSSIYLIIPYTNFPDTCLVGDKDAGVELDVSGLVHTVHVTEGRSDAEVGGDGPEGLLHSPDLFFWFSQTACKRCTRNNHKPSQRGEERPC